MRDSGASLSSSIERTLETVCEETASRVRSAGQTCPYPSVVMAVFL